MLHDEVSSFGRRSRKSTGLIANRPIVTKAKPIAYLLLSAGLVLGFLAGPLESAAEAGTPTTVTLYATPSGTASTGCTTTPTSASTACALQGAINVGASQSDVAITIDLVHSDGSACSSTDVCTFEGDFATPSDTEASLTIQGSGMGTGSSAQTVLNEENSITNSGTTFTNNATSSSAITLANVEVTGGNTANAGGGIANDGGSMTIVDSTIADNSTDGHAFIQGGGIYNAGSMTILDSTISNNSTNGNDLAQAGGILNNGSMTIVDSTIADNSVSGTSVIAQAGGIANGGSMTIVDSTISNNSADEYAGGIAINGSSTVVAGSIVDGNTKGASSSNCNGDAITNAGYNISNGSSCGFTSSSTSPHSLDGASVDLGTLGNYGGPTETAPLIDESGNQALGLVLAAPAVNLPVIPGSTTTTPVSLCGGSTTASENTYGEANLSLDQIGDPRLVNGATTCDAGAVEENLEAPAITSASYTTFTVGKSGSFTTTTSGFPTPSVPRQKFLA